MKDGFHMSLASPPTSSLGKQGDVTTPYISTAPIFLCMFTSALCEIGAHFIRPSWYVVTQLANARIPTPIRPLLGFLLKPLFLLISVFLEHTPFTFFTAVV